MIATIEALSLEITPFYLSHSGFINAKSDFVDGVFDDFEDLMILNSAVRCGCERFVTNGKRLLKIKDFKEIKISGVKS